MVSKHSAVRSIRLQKADWEWLSEEAARRETTVNGLVSEGVELVKLAALRRRAAEALGLAAEAEALNRRGALDDLGFVVPGERWEPDAVSKLHAKIVAGAAIAVNRIEPVKVNVPVFNGEKRQAYQKKGKGK